MHAPPANGFLRSLSQASFSGLASGLTQLELATGAQLTRPGDVISTVYFPVTAGISLLAVDRNGRTVETVMAGSEGAAGLLEALGSGVAGMLSIVQVEGRAVKMPAAAFRAATMRDPDLLAAALRLVELQLSEIRQSGLCHAFHAAEPRLARWLLESMDRCGGRTLLPLTQDYIAMMLGVQRTTVTEIVGQLQKNGLVKGHRGRLDLIDAQGLERLACECRQVACEERQRLGFEPVKELSSELLIA